MFYLLRGDYKPVPSGSMVGDTTAQAWAPASADHDLPIEWGSAAWGGRG